MLKDPKRISLSTYGWTGENIFTYQPSKVGRPLIIWYSPNPKRCQTVNIKFIVSKFRYLNGTIILPQKSTQLLQSINNIITYTNIVENDHLLRLISKSLERT